MNREGSFDRIFVSKKDRWLAVSLWLTVAGTLLTAAILFFVPLGPAFKIGFLALQLATAGFVLWTLHATHYTLTGQSIVVRSGPFRWNIPYEAIREVRPSRSPLSSPALSLDRLKIRYTGSTLGLLVSPEDKAKFLEELARQAGLRYDGDGAIRR